MTGRVIAISTVAFDGHPIDPALEVIAGLGITHVEPAYISGMMLFTEADLSTGAAAALRSRLASEGLSCLAVSAHTSCVGEDAPAKLVRRLRFAAELGASILITNTAKRDDRDQFLRNLETLLPVAEAARVALAFENPGHGADDLLRCGADAAALIAAIGSPWAVLNYDVGNALTNSEGKVRPETDLLSVVSIARQLHLKDMSLVDGRWVYTALGDGSLDYAALLPALRFRPDLPVCVELPLRQERRVGRAPTRGAEIPLPIVRDMLARSVERVRSG